MSEWRHAPAPLRRDHPVLGELWWLSQGREQPYTDAPHVGYWVSFRTGLVVTPAPYAPPSDDEITDALLEQGTVGDAMRWTPEAVS